MYSFFWFFEVVRVILLLDVLFERMCFFWGLKRGQRVLKVSLRGNFQERGRRQGSSRFKIKWIMILCDDMVIGLYYFFLLFLFGGWWAGYCFYVRDGEWIILNVVIQVYSSVYIDIYRKLGTAVVVRVGVFWSYEQVLVVICVG